MTAVTETVPTPAELRELASTAEALAATMDDVNARMRTAGDRPTGGVAFRLDHAAGQVRSSAAAARETAADLERVLARSDCAAEWGACPEHGDTLRSSGGVCWCAAPGCRRTWNHNRLGLPCDDPVAYAVRDGTGAEVLLCAGHAITARHSLTGDHRFTPTTTGALS